MTPRALGDESRQASGTKGEPEVQRHHHSLSIAHPGNPETEAGSSPHLGPAHLLSRTPLQMVTHYSEAKLLLFEAKLKQNEKCRKLLTPLAWRQPSSIIFSFHINVYRMPMCIECRCSGCWGRSEQGSGVGEGTLGTPIPVGVSPGRWTGGPCSCWGSIRVGGRQDSRRSGKGANAQGPRAAHRPPPQGLGLHQGRGLVLHSYLLTGGCGSSGLHPTEEKPSHPLPDHVHSRQLCCGESGEGPGGRMRAGPA